MEPLTNFRKVYLQSGMLVPYKLYRNFVIVFPILVFLLCFIVTYFLINYYKLPMYLILFPIFAAICASFLIVFYPYDKRAQRRSSIDTNLPYALNYMASISEIGISPVAMFDSIARFDVYGEISREAALIVKQTEVLGKDVLSVLEDQADHMPSESFKEILKGLISVLHAGGDVASYFRQKYNDVMFKKILKESEYEKALTIYEDIFTILFVVAPLLFFIFVMLGEIMSPGSLNAISTLKMLVYMFLPIANVIFIMVLKISRKD